MSPRQKQLLKHWQESNPKLVKELAKSGRLEQSLQEHVDRGLDVYAQAVNRGLNPDQARELEREELELAPKNEPD